MSRREEGIDHGKREGGNGPSLRSPREAVFLPIARWDFSSELRKFYLRD